MKIKCPHGYKSVARLGSITIENETVEILEGICDRPDRCGITTCEYYDTSREATRRFQAATAHCYGWGVLTNYSDDPRHLVPHFRLEALDDEDAEERAQALEHERQTAKEVAAWLAEMEAEGRIERIGVHDDGRPRYRLVPEHWQPQDPLDPQP